MDEITYSIPITVPVEKYMIGIENPLMHNICEVESKFLIPVL